MRPCKVSGFNRTKTFQVKQFCPIGASFRSKLMAHPSALPQRDRSPQLLFSDDLLNKNGATSPTPGGRLVAKGRGRQTAIAESPTRAVNNPFKTPSPSRADSFAAIPCPTNC